MKKIFKTLISTALAAIIAAGTCVTCHAESSVKGEEQSMTREEQFMDRVYESVCDSYTYTRNKDKLRVSQPFRIYNEDGTFSNRYHYFVFVGDKHDSHIELIEDDTGLHVYSVGGGGYDAVNKAYANGNKIALMSKNEMLYVVTKNSRIMLASTAKTEKTAAPDSVKLEKIKLGKLNIPDDYFDKKWEEELIYFSKYRKHKDIDFYEDHIVRAGGPRQWWLSWEDADRFRRAENSIIRLKYDDVAAVDSDYEWSDTKVRINIYLSYKECYTYTIQLKERFFASIPEILKETGLDKDEKYKDIIGIIIESPESYDLGSFTGRFMIGYDFCGSGWLFYGNETYYINKELMPVKGSRTIDGTRFVFDDNGLFKGTYTGWTKSSGKYRYWSNGILARGKAFRADGKLYAADVDGYVTEIKEN